jgi:hypothetical protein
VWGKKQETGLNDLENSSNRLKIIIGINTYQIYVKKLQPHFYEQQIWELEIILSN